MENCDTKCGDNDSCPSGQTCQLATNCHIEKITLRSDMLVTMQGPDRVMEGQDTDIFGGAMNEIIAEAAAEQGIKLGGVDVGDQLLADRRTLYERLGQRYLSLVLTIQQKLRRKRRS